MQDCSPQRRTDSNHAFNIAPNLLDQDVLAGGQNQKCLLVNSNIHLSLTGWDISYFWTREGWLDSAIILDLYSRRVIGWAISDRPK